MTGRWTILGAFAMLAVIAAVCLAVVLKIEIAPSAEGEKAKGPVRTRNFGEGIRLSQHGLYGVDLVSIGRAHMRKLRRGPFRIGALNELVLEDVALALPEELWKADAKPVDAFVSNASERKKASTGDAIETIASTDDRGTAAKRVLGALGVNPGHIRLGERIPRFSALTIRNLQVARLVDGTNTVPWFAAANAKAERAGLVLSSGWSVENGVSNAWREAFLAVEPKLALHHPF